jgi:hypothetical protein
VSPALRGRPGNPRTRRTAKASFVIGNSRRAHPVKRFGLIDRPRGLIPARLPPLDFDHDVPAAPVPGR